MHAIEPGELVLGSDNGSAFTARRFRARLAELGIRHRRGGYRDPESQAFIESWFGKLKEREVWLNEYETLDDARRGIGGYVDRYHHRPHSGLNYRTPDEVRQTWEDHQTTKTSGLNCQHRRGARQPHLRWGLIQAAQTAVQGDGPLKTFYEPIKHRRGSNVAKVAVAREILTLCYYGLRDGEIRRLEKAAARANSALALAPTGGPTG